MEKMFSLCNNLKKIDLSSLNTNKVENMDSMFFKCINLEFIKIKNLGNKKTKFDNIFSYCDKLKILDLTSYDKSSNFGTKFILNHIDIDKLETIRVKKQAKKTFFLKLFITGKYNDKKVKEDFLNKIIEV